MTVGQVRTVCGDIDPEQVGFTLPHEHLIINFEDFLCEHNDLPSCNGKQPFQLQSIGCLQYQPYSHRVNLQCDQVSDAVKEMNIYKEMGGKTLVDVTTVGIGYWDEAGGKHPTPEQLKQVSEETGVHIVMGTGYYVQKTLPPSAYKMSVDDMANHMIKCIREGFPVGDSVIKAGVIGEIGVTEPIEDIEKLTLQASAIAQRKTGAPLIIHPGRANTSPLMICDILKEAGADLKRTVMSHIDRTLTTTEECDELAKTGVILEWDLFGQEGSFYQLGDSYMPNDDWRFDMVKHMIDSGKGDQVMLSHDIHTKHRMASYGGHGFGHLLRILPRLKKKGVTDEQIKQITVDNPKKWLAFASGKEN
eukprot:Clim_evm61s207 gene=Clim_evmTU61s207